jgi:uncharacterized protein with HEPN domain
MSKSDELEFIEHIFKELKFVINTTSFITFDNFIEDETLKRAVVRAIEIVGEATKSLSFDFRQKYNYVPWKIMAGMRDKLIHDYWELITNWFLKPQQKTYQNYLILLF